MLNEDSQKVCVYLFPVRMSCCIALLPAALLSDFVDVQQLEVDYEAKIETLITAMNTLEVCINVSRTPLL